MACTARQRSQNPLMKSSKDSLFATKDASLGSFKFDGRVAAVFHDMISRSVPGYTQILNLLPSLVRLYQQDQANYYDLGCSLGAGMLAMTQGLEARSTIIGVDTSSEMLVGAQAALAEFQDHDYRLLCQSALDCEIENAAMVLMNFTLQFIELEQRDQLIAAVFGGLNQGGAFILSEKVKFEDPVTDKTLIDIHHQFKSDQGYSDLEIARKRDAIENVLIPETLQTHSERLSKAGFRVVTPWIQNLQFVSILAIK